jgi:GH24 family phage-related lysozyme (muramidase)
MSTIQRKLAEGFDSQGWDVIGRGGTWAAALRPLTQYIDAKIKRATAAQATRIAELEAEVERLRKPMTEEQIAAIAKSARTDIDFARAIEAAKDTP